MACGVVPIVTTNCGYEDFIENGKNGFVVPVRDHLAIADRLQDILELGFIKQKELSCESVKYVQKNNWQEYMKRLQNLYMNIAGN